MNHEQGSQADSRVGRIPLWARRLGLLLAALLAYASALGNGFVNMDDPRIVLEQPFLRSLSLANLWTCVWPFPVREEFLPVRDLTYLLNFALHGARPLGFVLGNLLLHGCVAIAVHGLARRVLRRSELPARSVEPLALTAGLLFAVHPIHVESVAWISARKDVLSGAFYVLCVSAYLDHLASAADDPARRRRYGLAALWAVLALGSKATAVSLPLVLLAADWLLHRERTWRVRGRALAPFFLGVALYAKGYTWLLARFGEAQGRFVVKQHPDDVLTALPFTNASVYRQYLQRLVAPFDQRLFSEQGYRHDLDLEVAFGVFVVGLALIGTAWLAGRRPALGLAAVLFWLALAPWNLVPHGILYGERYLYLPSIGFCLLFPVGAWALARDERKLALVVFPYLLLCTAQSLRLAATFKTGETLWAHVTEAEPENASALQNLANWYCGSDPAQPGVVHDAAQAERLYRRALTLRPDKASLHYNLGLLLERRGALDEALRSYQEAEARKARGHLKAVLGAASVLRKQGRWQQSVALYDAIVQRWPAAGAKAAFNKALVLEQAGQTAAAGLAWRAYLDRYGNRPEESAHAEIARGRLGG